MLAHGLGAGESVAYGLNSFGGEAAVSAGPPAASEGVGQAGGRGRGFRAPKRKRKPLPPWAENFVLPQQLDEARQALRKLAALLHPDKTIGLDAITRAHYTEIFTQATSAYHRLLAASVDKTPQAPTAIDPFIELYRAVVELEQKLEVLAAAVTVQQQELAALRSRPHWGWFVALGAFLSALVAGGAMLFWKSRETRKPRSRKAKKTAKKARKPRRR